MAKLVAIGDSLTQGFQSGAIKKTEWSFPAMIARSMGMSVPTDFRIPHFPGSGLPLNIEELLRFMEDELGDNISLSELLFRFPKLLNDFIDGVEDLYERGRGRLNAPTAFRGEYHNLAVWGFRVIDALKVNSQYSTQVIQNSEGRIEDDFLGLPSAPMHRTAIKVLNPGNQVQKKTWTQLDNLQKIHQQEGVENLILWLGANDCLGTVFNLNIKKMPTDFTSDDPEERRKYNLTDPDIFRRDYQKLVQQVQQIVGNNTNVFVATVPHVTIPPITCGIGTQVGKYFEYYGRFFVNKENFNPLINGHLKRAEAQEIDKVIDQYNDTIQQLVADAGNNWHIVDTSQLLDQLAVKRQNFITDPAEPLRAYFRSLGINDHPLLKLDPVPSILLLETDNHERKQGGLFALDCVHPSTIGYGLLAEYFLREMQAVGVAGANPNNLDWETIIAQDFLLQMPPALWDDILNTAERTSILWDVIFRILD